MKRSLPFTACGLACLLTAGGLLARAPAQTSTGENVVLVTLDGSRIEEVFGGLDTSVLESTLKEGTRVESTAAYRRFWAAAREERRRRLLPFLWQLVTEEGSIAGDPEGGTRVRLGNQLWFSYPGYAEILLGEPHDDVIKSNDALRNPYTTVLERIREQLQLPKDKVATFASWGRFNEIAEHVEGATLVNAGPERLGGDDPDVRVIDSVQFDARPPWDIIRHDAFTFRLAMRHLALARPRVLYVAFDETDDWAHDGKYDRVLDAYSRIDGYLKELWTWLQSQPEYRGRTHLLVTTDHGRGHTLENWRNHGEKVPDAADTWMAFVSPRMTARGVWQSPAPLSTSQVAATVASWMGVDWNADHPRAGKPVR